MSMAVLEKKIALLPENYINEVIDFVEFLVAKSTSSQGQHDNPPKRKAGIAKDPDFYMAPDFDEPLDAFKEYM